MLSDLGLDVITVRTNAWELLPPRTVHYPASGVASALHVVAGRFGAGLFAATASYRNLVLPFDSSPVSDRMLGSSSFEIVHDGAAYNRLEKLRRLAEWDEAMRNLRFCLRDPRHDRNCGRCHKCLLTFLAFRVLGVEPRCFETPPTPGAAVAWARNFPGRPMFVAEMRAILDEANARGLNEPWVRATRRRLQVIAARRALGELSPTLTARASRAYRRLSRR